MSLAPHQIRVVDEQRELDEKLAKLTAFIDSPTFLGVPGDERLRLQKQQVVMRLYSEVLEERIVAFHVTAE